MKEIQSVKVRRVNIVKDVLEIFSKPEVLKQVLRVEFTNENAIDDDGVSRELYTAFWKDVLAQCEGEDERVPRLRPDYSEREWQAVGRVWVKGYVDHGVMPIRLSPAFILACIDGVDSVVEELLMSSFFKYLSASEQSVVEKAIQGNLDENNAEDLLDLFSRMGSYCLPPKENIRSAILTMAHKVLLQEPKFIIDCFRTIMPTGILNLTRQCILEAYESKKATNKKVSQMIKPAKDCLNQQEQLTLNHLQRYVKNLDQRKLETFSRFCTGSTVMCKDKIEVMFNVSCGLGRRPVAHTCGAVLDLPCTYSSYPEFRAEFDNVLNGDCFAMDIL
ncbi:uncharacterized protein LOC132122967 [Carassius carassius]|uniref:uncharacterized protein LOC132122967 n=1 Tax=Carassius carassius TaxID=217509 RepID=UPI0028697873|nr:uncharacterized protein LOC132122967 [Carassius carassius]